MPQSLANVLIHTVFSTKGREPYLADKVFRDDAHAYLGGVIKTLKCYPIKIGGTADHIHLLTTLARTITIADFIKEVKRASTYWIQNKDQGPTGFHWQAGYASFSVGQSEVHAIVRYIDGQEAHHQEVSFQDEYRRLLREHKIEFDEKYVWD